jgi:hypothetical protein
MRRFIATIATLAVGAAGVSGATAAAPKARKTTNTAYASIVRQEGSRLIAAGYFVDKVLGKGAVIYRVQAAAGDQPATTIVTADPVTLYTAKGTLTGTGSATNTNNPDGTATISAGKLNLTKGTGSLKGHTLVGTFTGTFANNVFTFNTTATYR